MIKASKLWDKAEFKRLSNDAKLLYLRLTNSKEVSILGTFLFLPEELALMYPNKMKELRPAAQQLSDEGLIKFIKGNGEVYAYICKHFSTIIKSPTLKKRVTSTLESLPETVRNEVLEDLGDVTTKFVDWKEPTPDEITSFAMTRGHVLDGKKVFDYYSKAKDSNGRWRDSRGTLVHDWKRKVATVWCRDENKIKEVKGAPKGFESFHIKEDGKVITPNRWIGGIPRGASMSIDIKLKKAYDQEVKRRSSIST